MSFLVKLKHSYNNGDLKISELKELIGLVKHSIHDIKKGYNVYNIETDNQIYKLKIKSYWDDIYGKLEGRKIKIKGILDADKREISNPADIWIKLLKNDD